MKSENREIRKLKKKLREENKKEFEKIELRLRSSNIRRDIYLEIIRDLLGAIIEGQIRNSNIESILGKDLESFCDEIIENAIKETLIDKIVRILYEIIAIISVSFLIIYIMGILFGMDNYSAMSRINHGNVEIYLADVLVFIGIVLIQTILNKLKYKFVFNRHEKAIKKVLFILEVFAITSINKIEHDDVSFSLTINIVIVAIIFALNHIANRIYLKKQKGRSIYG